MVARLFDRRLTLNAPQVRLHAVGHVLGRFLLMMGATTAVPLAFTLRGGTDSPRPMVIGLIATALAGAALVATFRKPERELSIREALLTVVVVWVAVSLFGSLPFYFSPYFDSFTDAMFESTSGFTTTGASILSDVAVLPRSLQFWRHFSQWLGGMGIIMLGIAILPLVGAGGRTLYNAQFAAEMSEKLKPRVLETAHALWAVYIGLTAAQFVALRFAGMDIFDAICHTFTSLSTGGFSTRTTSIAYYRSLPIEIIIVVFMIAGSLNFAVIYRCFAERHPRALLQDSEVRFLLIVLTLATLGIACTLVRQPAYAPGAALRDALFQATSIGTTTGFATADYERWHPFAQIVLLALMYFGGNTGSTAGGFKSFRIVLLLKVIRRAMTHIVNPRRVLPVKVGGTIIPDSALSSLLNLVILALGFNFIASLLLAASGVDLVTSLSTVPACMFSVGPALGTAGPVENYAGLPAFAKWVLTVSMLVGRMEFYTALVILTPGFWRR
jgi:trk system potassium uptake protein TrkH